MNNVARGSLSHCVCLVNEKHYTHQKKKQKHSNLANVKCSHTNRSSFRLSIVNSA
jgi:hypothetical protein